MNRQIVAAALTAALSLSGVAGTYLATKAPGVTVQTPTVVYTETPCGRMVDGCYHPDRPNQIEVQPTVGPATINHETLHFISNRDGLDWTECQVSYINFTRYGLEDAYTSAGYCKDGLPTGKSPKELD